MTCHSRLPTAIVLGLALFSASGTVRAAAPATPSNSTVQASVPEAKSADAAPALPPLTLNEAVARALDQNFSLTIQRLATTSAKESVIIADAGFDPTLTASTNKTRSQTSILGETVPNSLRDTTNTSVGISELISTGANVGAGTTFDRSKAGTGGLNPAYNGSFSLTVRQPLLQGAGSAVTYAARERARLGVKLANSSLKDSVLSVVRSVESAYYNLAFSREQLGVLEFARDVAQKLLKENQDRLAIGVSTQLDVLQSDVALKNAELGLIQARQTVRDREDALLVLISRSGLDQPVGPVVLGDEPVPEVSVARSYALARESQPSLNAARLAIDQTRLELVTAKNNLLPSLDVSGAVALSSTEASYDRAATESLTGHGYDWQLGLTLTLPWGMRAAQASYRQARNTLTSDETNLQQIDLNLLASVRSAVRAVETDRESVATASLARNLSQQQYEQEKARYDAGLSTVRLVNDSNNDLNNAKIAELQLRVALRQALADLARLETTSLERYKIRLED